MSTVSEAGAASAGRDGAAGPGKLQERQPACPLQDLQAPTDGHLRGKWSRVLHSTDGTGKGRCTAGSPRVCANGGLGKGRSPGKGGDSAVPGKEAQSQQELGPWGALGVDTAGAQKAACAHPTLQQVPVRTPAQLRGAERAAVAIRAQEVA